MSSRRHPPSPLGQASVLLVCSAFACTSAPDNGAPAASPAVNDAGSPNAQSLDGSASSTTIAFDQGPFFDGLSRLSELPETTCTVTVTGAEVSPHISTVGLVTFTTDLPAMASAEVHFGTNADYGLVAPVNLDAANHRTLLLGMTENRTFHFRVAVSDGNTVCYSEDSTLQTGSLDSPALSSATTSSSSAPGFIITSHDGNVVVYNKQGELVWAYEMWNVFSVKMSWDGQYMLGRDPGPFDLGVGGLFYRVKMDGSDFEPLDAPGGDHHDFAVIPQGIAYLAKGQEGECDHVYEASTEIKDGSPRFDTWPLLRYFPDEGVVEGTEICHANRIHYLASRDIYTISDRNKDVIALFDREGTPLASIGKAPTEGWSEHVLAEGAGPGGEWHVQHGHHLYAQDKLVVFSNESASGAAVLHYTITGDDAVLDWKYAGAGASPIQGDVQRLPNGNFLVTANLSGTIVELGPDGQTEVGRYALDSPAGPTYGYTYSTHQPSLYPLPPQQ